MGALCGAQGDCEHIALRPDEAAGNYQKRIDRFQNFRTQIAERQARLRVPEYAPHIGRRVVSDIAVYPTHEVLDREVHENKTLHAQLKDAIDYGELPDAYMQHPVVRRGGARGCFPVSIYLDGTPYTKRDGVLVWVAVNVISGMRHLICVQRKRRLCRCGCRGWCSLWPVFNLIRYCLEALAVG
ncbi:hypothetical protein N9L68_05230 [bacterium]|nr:hypothetical protein [bacterium]